MERNAALLAGSFIFQIGNVPNARAGMPIFSKSQMRPQALQFQHHNSVGRSKLIHIDAILRAPRQCLEIATVDSSFVHTRPVPDALSLIHISEPTRRTPISYAVFCLKK